MKLPFLGCLYRDRDPEILRLLRTLTQEMKMVQQKIDELKVVVGEQRTVIGSMSTLMDRLLAEVEGAKDDPAELQDVIDKFRANTAAIAAEVARGTAAQGETPPSA